MKYECVVAGEGASVTEQRSEVEWRISEPVNDSVSGCVSE